MYQLLQDRGLLIPEIPKCRSQLIRFKTKLLVNLTVADPWTILPVFFSGIASRCLVLLRWTQEEIKKNTRPWWKKTGGTTRNISGDVRAANGWMQTVGLPRIQNSANQLMCYWYLEMAEMVALKAWHRRWHRSCTNLNWPRFWRMCLVRLRQFYGPNLAWLDW